MKKYSAISVLVIILSLMIYFSFYFNQEKENVINCEAKLIIYDKEDTKANLELMFTLGEEQGWASIRGIIDYNGDLIPVYRKSFFDITKLKTSYKLASTQILINDNNSEIINKIIPNLYVKEGWQRSLSVFSQNDGGYLFSSNNVYSFYCY
ncbi:TPA: hypothetical protein ACNIAT_000694 [Proteus mirabilis]|uniref:hypothetical protein n=1 Tax=Proteus mirabilis TaxID=584 RepID=UPI002296BA40|nr:hypothetical protein [Proteus mirabilis]